MGKEQQHIIDFISDMRNKKQTFVYGGTVPTHIALASLYERIDETRTLVGRCTDEIRTINSQIVTLSALLSNTNSRLNIASKQKTFSDGTFAAANEQLAQCNALLEELKGRGNLVIGAFYNTITEVEKQVFKLNI